MDPDVLPDRRVPVNALFDQRVVDVNGFVDSVSETEMVLIIITPRPGIFTSPYRGVKNLFYMLFVNYGYPNRGVKNLPENI